MDPQTTTFIVWTVRIILPALFFWVWFRLQRPKESSAYAGPTKHKHPREVLLAGRASAGGQPVPQSLGHIKMAPEASLGMPGGRATPKRGVARSKNKARAVDESAANSAGGAAKGQEMPNYGLGMTGTEDAWVIEKADQTSSWDTTSTATILSALAGGPPQTVFSALNLDAYSDEED
eukprot:gnl/TRDRNA2_/TRDRNA2_187706_c0_seq1.p1 gnl/TRDRNA2_/TRDRNA2_187706_c0~~gnl/TRDRNA2_/TRDRNA2_187706_c0_seq1.p1  ORF type:complete len:177 (-),score=27.61 gnl/TRDRNA2_/TRDRNA2_187706_c0_seq1:162-692(-)